MPISAVSHSNFASPSVASVAASPKYTNQQLAAMTAAQIGAITPVDMAALNKNQIRYFQPQALADGLGIYLANNNPRFLPPNVTPGLTNPQINLFSAPVVNASMAQMTPAQIGAINPAVISQLYNDFLNTLSGIQLNALTTPQIGQLTPEQLGYCSPETVGKLSAGWLNKLTESQIQSFAASSLTLPQLKDLNVDHVKFLSGTQVADLNTAQLGVLAGKQIAAIDPDDIGMMNADKFIILKQDQLKALTTGQVDKLDSAKVNNIRVTNFKILSYLQIQHFSDEVLTHLNGQHLGAMTAQQISKGLDAHKIGLLSPDQVKDANFNSTQIQALTISEIRALSVDDLKVLTDTQLTAFKVDQLANFTDAQNEWLYDNKLDAGFTKAQLKEIIKHHDKIHFQFTLGQAVIDLGSSGTLIAPHQVEGKWYYFWDRSGDGTWKYPNAQSGPLHQGYDTMSHDELNAIFNQDINGVVGGGGSTNDTYRYATINGVRLALPTVNGTASLPNAINAEQPGTAYKDEGARTNGTSSSTYDELFAVWDAHNDKLYGRSGYNHTGVNVWNRNGVPAGWPAYDSYWSASRDAAAPDTHDYVSLSAGIRGNINAPEWAYKYVALQVLPPQ